MTFVYPASWPASEDTPIGDVPMILRSALTAERQATRFAAATAAQATVPSTASPIEPPTCWPVVRDTVSPFAG